MAEEAELARAAEAARAAEEAELARAAEAASAAEEAELAWAAEEAELARMAEAVRAAEEAELAKAAEAARAAEAVEEVGTREELDPLDPEPSFDRPYPEESIRDDRSGRSEPRLWPVFSEPTVGASYAEATPDELVPGEMPAEGLENQSEAWALPNHVGEGELVSRHEPNLSPAVRDLFAETGLSISPDERPAAPPRILAARRPRSRRLSEFLAGAATAMVAVAIYLLVTHPGNFPGHATPTVATATATPSSVAAAPPASSVATGPANEVHAVPAPVAHASPENGATDTAAAKAAPGADALPSEILPPQQGVGQLLSPEEVRYCVFQGRRLGYLRDQIVSNDSVQRFNTLLADFNSRCKSFRYEGDALQSANSQADARQDQLKADAGSILTSWTGGSATSLIDLQTHKGAAQVQAKLKALGYYSGKADGAWGPKSAAALSKFRQANDLGADSLWDLTTQSALLGKR
ncbi:MAG: peptidoglycan-binding protein [Dongiales bacterium]